MCNNSKFLNETEKENIISYILRGKIKIFIILRPLGYVINFRARKISNTNSDPGKHVCQASTLGEER